MNEERKNPWTTLSGKAIYKNPWIELTEFQVINPNGGEGIYGKIHYQNRAIGVVPLDDEHHTWLIGQWRYPLERYSWEIPEGGGAKHETPLKAAQRELKEEAGLEASQWDEILQLDVSNCCSDEEATLFLARGITVGKSDPDEDEELEIRRVPLAQAVAMVHDGEITDALSVAALLKVDWMLRDLPSANA